MARGDLPRPLRGGGARRVHPVAALRASAATAAPSTRRPSPIPSACALLAQFAAADLEVRIWDTTSDVGVASFCCLVAERSGEFADPEYGNGCHPAREVALLRALTEAAQARVTYISGARDDYPVDAWEPAIAARRLDALGSDLTAAPSADGVLRPTCRPSPHLRWQTTSPGCSPRLRAAGVDEVIAVDLGKEALGFPSCASWFPASRGRMTGSVATRRAHEPAAGQAAHR